MDFSRWLQQFPAVSDDPAGYLVPCPAHDDAHPSLLLTLKEDGKLLVHCRAGCERSTVLAALGMEERDLFGWRPGDGVRVAGASPVSPVGPAEIAGLRVWLDACAARWELLSHSELAAAAGRYIDRRFGMDAETARRLGIGLSPTDADHLPHFPYVTRKFRQFPRIVVPFYGFDGVARGAQGRDISGECSARWVSLANPCGMTWAKYGVLHGSGEFDTIVITEGPSDGLTLAALGYGVVMVRGAAIASNSALAAEIAEGVKGRRVVIAGDHDAAGESFVRRLGDALREHGAVAHRLALPSSVEDVTDWRERHPESFAEEVGEAIQAAAPIEPPRNAVAAIQGRVIDRDEMDMVTTEDGERAAKILREYTDRFGPTDVMRAHALVAFAEGRIRYATGLGYYVWSGRHWEPSEVRVKQWVHRMAAALMLAGRTDEARPFGTARLIEAMMRELKAVPGIAVRAVDFDTNPHLLSFRNGTVDLRTGNMREHRPEDMITRYVDADYDPSAECPRWQRFLREIFPDRPELAEYMQRLVGYGITGETSEQCFVVLWGTGANGKSVLTDVLTHTFREISATTPFATFEEKQGGIPNDLAALRGARLVFASEGESGKPMAEAVLKRVTGSDEISARFLRREFFTFKPAFLLFLATNHKPRFRGQDEGLWRRVKLLQFSRYFAPDERDHKLSLTLKREVPGIVAWAVRGAMEWYSRGLQDPDAIRDATREYRETSDPLAGFLPDVLEITGSPTDSVVGTDAFNAYMDWVEAENLPPKERWTRRKLFAELEMRGAARKKTAKGIVLYGVRIPANTSPNGSGNKAEDQADSGRRIFD